MTPFKLSPKRNGEALPGFPGEWRTSQIGVRVSKHVHVFLPDDLTSGAQLSIARSV